MGVRQSYGQGRSPLNEVPGYESRQCRLSVTIRADGDTLNEVPGYESRQFIAKCHATDPRYGPQ